MTDDPSIPCDGDNDDNHTDGRPGGDASATVDGETDHADRLRELYDIPFHRAEGIEVVAVTDETARIRWPFDESLVGNPEVPAVHGGVVSALVDLTGAAPHVAALGRYTPTVDLRVDYLTHAGEADLVAEAEVRRRGDSVGVSAVTVYSGEVRCAVGKGVYKLSE